MLNVCIARFSELEVMIGHAGREGNACEILALLGFSPLKH